MAKPPAYKSVHRGFNACFQQLLNYYTLQQMVEANIVKPLVILASCANNGGYYFPNVLNVYSGGSSDSGNYPSLLVYFMLNSGHKITGAKWSMANVGGGDINFGWNVFYAPVSEFRMTLS